MVDSLQQRFALVALVGVLLIPLLATNMRGLTHLLTCSEGVAQSFAISEIASGEPAVTSSTSLERGGEDEVSVGGDPSVALGSFDGLLCDALRVEVSARTDGPDTVLLTVRVTNDTSVPWSGTLGLAADGDAVSIGSGLNAELGRVEPGEEAQDTLELRVPPGQTELEGTLLLGP